MGCVFFDRRKSHRCGCTKLLNGHCQTLRAHLDGLPQFPFFIQLLLELLRARFDGLPQFPFFIQLLLERIDACVCASRLPCGFSALSF